MKFMTVMHLFSSQPYYVSGSSSPSLSNILAMATELFTWVVTQMGATLTFITSNPLIFLMVLMMLVGFVFGCLRRVSRILS